MYELFARVVYTHAKSPEGHMPEVGSAQLQGLRGAYMLRLVDEARLVGQPSLVRAGHLQAGYMEVELDGRTMVAPRWRPEGAPAPHEALAAAARAAGGRVTGVCALYSCQCSGDCSSKRCGCRARNRVCSAGCKCHRHAAPGGCSCKNTEAPPEAAPAAAAPPDGQGRGGRPALAGADGRGGPAAAEAADKGKAAWEMLLAAAAATPPAPQRHPDPMEVDAPPAGGAEDEVVVLLDEDEDDEEEEEDSEEDFVDGGL